MVAKRGIIVWISAFVTFLSISTSFYIGTLMINEGPNSPITPYLLGDLIGPLSAETYLWTTVSSTFIFLGITCLIIYRRQPPNPELVKLLLKVGGNLAALRKSQEASVTEIVDQIDYGRKVNQKFFSTVTSDLQEEKKEMLGFIEKQGKVVKKVRSELISVIETKTNETIEKISADLKKQESVINGVKRISEESTKGLKTQLSELEDIKLRLEKIEDKILPNQSSFKSTDNSEIIKGIGPALGSELRMLGINSVGEFLTTDAEIIGEKTRISREMAENLQASAQLMMIPGVGSNDAELLLESGIKTRKELAIQDLIPLSKRIGEIVKIWMDQGKISQDEIPTIEKISSWIRMAR
ncbi:DUF4332 domain-containing protein [Candidatus Bathyarchaeota archaeon]|nr:DUF4332 domain-containing protein [Candidatus Bathyarchaeota archaeon]